MATSPHGEVCFLGPVMCCKCSTTLVAKCSKWQLHALLLLQVLGRKERSLAHLLRRYCGVQQDKTHQTADWRLRPLAPELHAYARADVHWLPYLAGLLVEEMQARSPGTTGVSELTRVKAVTE